VVNAGAPCVGLSRNWFVLKTLGILSAALLVAGAVAGGRWAGGAFEVATGYSAKQMCSGVFVAGLPETFVMENDIQLSLGTLGPLMSRLMITVDEGAQLVTSRLFGSESRAVYQGDRGCVLIPTDMAPAAVSSAVRAVPASVDVDARAVTPALAAVLERAFSEPDDEQRRTLAVVVSHRGRIIAERYAKPAAPGTPLQGWSMNKSLMATWIGIQVERGELDLASPVAARVAESDPALAAKVDPALNLGHLLHMESGFAFEETYFPGDDATRMLYRSPAMWRIAPGNGHRHAPGVHFSYSSGDTNLASYVWQASLDRPYHQWIEEEFRKPLKLWSLTAEHDATGVQVGSSYTYMTATDWLAVGEFWLRARHAASPLLSQAWMRAATTPRPAAARGNYGRGFWLNAKGLDFPGLPRDMFYASGHNGQYVVVFPAHELVVVRLGLSRNGRASGIRELLAGVLTHLPEEPAPAPLEVALRPDR
jgi:CubicO group peptidase (beta-lactamase class C family)